MTGLIEFILSNLFWIIVIAYIAMQFLGKKERTQNPGKPEETGNTRETGRTVPNPWEEIPRSTAEERLRKTIEIEPYDPRDYPKSEDRSSNDTPYEVEPYDRPYDEPYEYEGETPYEVTGDTPYERPTYKPYKREDYRKRTPSGTRQREQEDKDFAKLHPQNAVQGMIWAEVFAKPRSLQPHFTSLRYVKKRNSNG